MNIKSINWYGLSTCLFVFFFNKNSNTSYTYCHILLPMVGGLRVVILDYETKKPSYYNPGFNDCVILLDTNLQIDYSHISLDFFTSDQQAVCETEEMLGKGNLR